MIGYKFLDLIHQGAQSEVWRATDSAGRKVIIKRAFKSGTDREVARLQYEYRIIRALNDAGAKNILTAIDLYDAPEDSGLVMEDTNAQSITEVMRAGALSVADIVSIAVQVSETLIHVHQARIVHKDINPNNILLNRATGAVSLIDFGIAAYTISELQTVDNLHNVEGTLAYFPPEQTGRTNGFVDSRSDIYALGATLYQLLTQRLLFDEDDVTKLVYSILARQPEAIRAINPACPPIVADIIMLMLRKSPDERYQSSYGLHRDWCTCLEQIQAGATPKNFPLKTDDRSEIPEVPQILYGRAKDVKAVRAAYEDAAQGHIRVALITGPSGIGKSALVTELQRSIMLHDGLYLAGKSDQLRRHVPFDAFSQAITSWVHHLLAGPEREVEEWRRATQNVLGQIGQALVEVVPELELLVGRQKMVPPLGPQETENRLILLMGRFIRCLSRKQPLVLFLDDLQWADSGTFRLCKALATDLEVGAGLLLIIAYRDNEVDATHPLTSALRDIHKALPLDAISVQPLDVESARTMLADTTHSSPEEVSDLAELVIGKTGGNPFFMREFINHLIAKKLISFDPAKRAIAWDLAAIRSADVTDNVVNLMADKIRELSPDEQGLLSRAACLGAHFSLKRLQAVTDLKRADVLKRLGGATARGFLMPLQSGHRYAENTDEDINYKFAHDRIQQAAYEMMPPLERYQAHLTMGRRLAALNVGKPVEAWVFDVVDHLNKAGALIEEASEKTELAGLNCVAAKEAMRSAAYSVSLNYYAAARALLDVNDWRGNYAILRELNMGQAQCEFLLGGEEKARDIIQTILPHLHAPIDTAYALRLIIRVATSQGKTRDAVSAALTALRQLGVPVPSNPKLPSILKGMLKVRLALRNKDVAKLPTAPSITDERLILAQEILQATVIPAYTTNQALSAVILLTMAHIAITRGNTPTSAFAYVALTMVYCQLNNYDLSLKFAEVARACLKEIRDTRSVGSTLSVSYAWGFGRESPQFMQDTHYDAYRICLEAGDPVSANWSYCFAMAAHGQVSLRDFEADDPQRTKAMAAMEPYQNSNATSLQQTFRCLAGKTNGPLSLSDKNYDEATEEARAVKIGGSAAGAYYSVRLMPAWTNRDFDRALRCIEGGKKFRTYETSNEQMAVQFAMYAALTLTQQALLAGTTFVTDAKTFKRARTKISVLAKASPRQMGGLTLLVDAEVAALKGHNEEALFLYERGVEALSNSDFKSFYAAALECAGRFYVRLNLHAAAAFHLMQARMQYERWGAAAKVELLNEEFPRYLSRSLARRNPLVTESNEFGGHILQNTQTATRPVGSQIDMGSVIQASQTLSQEVVPEKLIELIMQLLIENSGATHGALLFSDGAQLTSRSGKGRDEYPSSVTSFVFRTQEVVVGDVGSDSRFSSDPHFVGHQSLSVLCAPLVQRGKTTGVVYLENTLNKDAFSKERVTLVGILASQAAISLENARLYEGLERTVAERTAELQAAHEKLLRVTRESTELAMAGGFAHEMRNALAGASYVVTAQGTGLECLNPLKEALGVLREVADYSGESTRQPEVEKALEGIDAEMEILTDTMKVVAKGLERGLNITKSILNYAQIGYLQKGETVTNLRAVVDKLLEEMNDEMKDARIVCAVEMPDVVNAEISEEHAYLILRNLIANAKDALKNGSKSERRIWVRCKRGEGVVRFDVADNGEGIPQEVQVRIFEPFFTTKGAAGTGLGLGLCRKLVDLYGGGLQFTSQQSRGTTFTLELPTRA